VRLWARSSSPPSSSSLLLFLFLPASGCAGRLMAAWFRFLSPEALACCCAPDRPPETSQLRYVKGDSLREETLGIHRNAPPYAMPSSEWFAGHQAPISQTKGASPSRVDEDSGACRGPRSADEKRDERDRLQGMVKEFAKAVVQGQPCQWLPCAGEAPRRATYSLDATLAQFSLLPDRAPSVQFDLLDILEVVKDVQETPFSELHRLPPPHEVAGLELEKRFVCIQHQGRGLEADDRGVSHLGLLMPDAYERDRFYMCMKILRWAQQSRRDRGG